MQEFKTALYKWYHLYQRYLPWRQTNDAYKIWISEIILQQTRVAQGTDYYHRFIERFPTVTDLASAHEDEVLKLWQGLGYYSRARNLHAAAKTIANNYSGIFPNKYETIIKLKGIGPYTAAAIASIAFSLPFATIDGNVYRVLSRYFGIATPIDSTQGKKEFTLLANEVLDKNAPGLHNQALMEFGALQCVPKSPKCFECPLHSSCHAFANDLVSNLPVKEKKTRQSLRYFYYYLLESGSTILMEKRTQNDIWKNLYQLPLLESDRELSDQEILNCEIPFLSRGKYNITAVSETRKHILSHRIIMARTIRAEISEESVISKALLRVNKKDISKFAVPRLVELFLKDYKLGE
ncbi:A/G-specific adenine glycosylase [Maribellus sp. YY47]|uniref:A/G-specific adenine glycosylase n=1 Tax=Maribellus sp. YY47 TaxID=2929486 RepID=UPI002000DBCC|nr:A/G-specific adenine glycosylase [Maribellus sp. YY47]MCK3682924.1 A/G-specific adenine glycosylase [Maribellus sp. YY47]